jgi:hypothetical protein
VYFCLIETEAEIQIVEWGAQQHVANKNSTMKNSDPTG